jgi:hypothetical protein
LIEGTPSEEEEKTLKNQIKKVNLNAIIKSKAIEKHEKDVSEFRICKFCKENYYEGKDGICAPCFIISGKKHVLTYPDEDEEGIQTLY